MELQQLRPIVPDIADPLVDRPEAQHAFRRRVEQCTGITLYFTEPHGPVCRFQDHGHPVMQHRELLVGSSRQDGEGTQHLSVGRSPAFPDAGERQRIAIGTGDGIGDLPIRCGSPFIESGSGTRQRRLANAALNIPDVATVSERALIGRRASLSSLVRCGTNPQFSASRWRSPVSGWQRTTGASRRGAMFQVAGRLGVAFTVPNNRAMNSGGRKLA